MSYIHKIFTKLTQLKGTLSHEPKKILMTILLILAVITVILLIANILEIIMECQHNRHIEKDSVLLDILPKETAKIKDTEALIKNIHGVLVNTKWRKVVYGRPYMSFEIGATQGKIKFYIRVPKQYKEVITERIYSTYPETAIREVFEDYIPDKISYTNMDVIKYLYKLCKSIINKTDRTELKPPKNHLQLYGTEMELGYHHVLSIKTCSDRDLLSSLMAGMKNLEWHETVSVQILARPLDNSWQIRGRRILSKYEKDGKRPTRGNDFSNFFTSFSDMLTDGLDEELEKQGFGSFRGKVNRKTKIERKEISVASDKLLESGFETVIRVMSIGHFGKANISRVKGITAAFNELDKENRFKRDVILAKNLFFTRAKNRRMYLVDRKNILSTSELSSFFLRLPGQELIQDFPDVEALTVKEFAPPRDVETETNIFAKNTYRGKETLIGIKDKDLVRHVIVEGATGSGKSEWIKTLLKDHIEKGRGLMLLEPHGKLADEFLALIPEHRRKDVVLFDLFDSHPPEFNFCKVFKRKGVSLEDSIEQTSASVIEIFKRTFSDAWSGKNENYFENGIKTVIELQNGDILDIQRLFSDKGYRNYALKKIRDPQVRHFWTTEFTEDARGNLSQGTQSTVNSVMYKLAKFLNSKKLLRAIAQENCIDFKEILDKNKILIFRLSKETMAKDRISFIGGIATKLIIDAAFQRDKSQWNSPFILAIDEAQNFLNENIETVLDELRKFGISLLPMHQRLAQLDKVPGLKDAIYGNAGTTITFTVGKPDAPYFESIYGPRVDRTDLNKLPSRYGYCRLMVDGRTSDTFNIYSLDSPRVDKDVAKQTTFEIRQYNRENRLSAKEIDKLLAEKIGDYKKVDEIGDVPPDPEDEDFSEDISEEFEKARDTAKIKTYTENLDPYEEDQRMEDEGFMLGNPPFNEMKNQEQQDSEEEPEFKIEINRPFEFLGSKNVDNKVSSMDNIKKEVATTSNLINEHEKNEEETEEINIKINTPIDELFKEKEVEILKEYSSPAEKKLAKITIGDLFNDKEEIADNAVKKVEVKEEEKKVINDTLIQKKDIAESNRIKIDIESLNIPEEVAKIPVPIIAAGEKVEVNTWKAAQEKEKGILETKKEETSAGIEGKSLWEMARAMEKQKKGR